MWLKVVTHVFEGLEKYQEAIENVRKPPAPLSMIEMACQGWEKGNLKDSKNSDRHVLDKQFEALPKGSREVP